MRLFRFLGASALSLVLLAGCGKEGQDSGAKTGVPTASGPSAAVKGTPVVTFEGGAITLEQLQSYIAQMNPQARTRLETPAQRREYAEGLARFELFAAEARRRGLENDPAVQEAMKRALVQQLLSKEFDEKTEPVTEKEISGFYETHKAEFIQPARSRYSHLRVPAPQGSGDRAAKKQKAQALREKALKLQPLDFDAFDALIPEASGNPAAQRTEVDTQLVTSEELKAKLGPEVAAAAEKLKQPGELSGVVEDSQGFHLLKLTDVRPAKNQTLESVGPQVRARILRERRDARVAKFTEELQSRAGFRTDEATLQKLQVDPQAPQTTPAGLAPGFLPKPPPTQ